MKIKKPDYYLQFLNKEAIILLTTNQIVKGQVIDWDNDEIRISKKISENPLLFQETTILKHHIKEIKNEMSNL
jgi:hypothetical protein